MISLRLFYGWLVFLLSVSWAQLHAAPESEALYEFQGSGSMVLSRPTTLGVATQERLPDTMLPTWSIALSPQDEEVSLAVTIYFRKGGGWLRLLWVNESENGHESRMLDQEVGLPGQTTFLLPSSIIKKPTTLTLQTSGEPELHRLHLQRVKSQSVLQSETESAVALKLPHATLRTEDLTGAPLRELVDSWNQNIITAVLVDNREKLDADTDLLWELDRIPTRARLSAEVLGIEMEDKIEICLNQSASEIVKLSVPDLNDPAHFTMDSRNGYAGWRELQFWIPQGVLTSGQNTLRLWTRSGKPITLRKMVLQLDYKEKKDVHTQP